MMSDLALESVFVVAMMFLALGILIGLIIGSGLEDREAREASSYCPTWKERRDYRKSIMNESIETMEKKGREVKDYLDYCGELDDLMLRCEINAQNEEEES